jgi:Icc-related predicted phosphoesterase
VVHASDHHGSLRKLPHASIYIITGDMLPDFGGWRGGIKPHEFMSGQSNWTKGKNLRDYLENRDAPVVLVRGNHDFIDYAHAYGGEVYDIQDPSVVFNVKGLRIGGCRGVAFIGLGWSDELFDHEFDEVVAKLPTDLDIMVTHAPPYGILDEIKCYGSKALTYYLQKCSIVGKPPKLWCFGHTHYDCGKQYFGETLMSNAATTVHEFNLDFSGENDA